MPFRLSRTELPASLQSYQDDDLHEKYGESNHRAQRLLLHLKYKGFRLTMFPFEAESIGDAAAIAHH